MIRTDGAGSGGVQTLNYPYGGKQEVETRLGQTDRDSFVRDDPSLSENRRALVFGGIGTLPGAVAGGAYGLHKMRTPGEYGSKWSRGGAITATIAAALVVGAAIGGASYLLPEKRVPELARRDAERAVDFEAIDRPPLPDAKDVPESPGTPKIGVVRKGITGSSAGQGVRLQNEWSQRLATTTSSTVNTDGNPVISVGGVSGTTIEWTDIVRREDVEVNSLGLGRVLYDPKGYESLDEAIEAFDGRHAVAAVKEGDRYYLADFDAQSYDGIGSGSNAMMLSDQRIAAVLVAKGVYYPTDLNVGAPARDGVAPGAGSRLFMFGHDQDIDRTVPPALSGLRDRPIGWYDTNAPERRDEGRKLTQLRIGDFAKGDEYSGAAFATKDEALKYMLDTPGKQGLVSQGGKHYVSNLYRDGDDANYGEATTLDDIVSRSTQGSYIHGLRTTGEASRFSVIEDDGGLYAPVGEWWVRMNGE